jgi:hypothetical protein
MTEAANIDLTEEQQESIRDDLARLAELRDQ